MGPEGFPFARTDCSSGFLLEFKLNPTKCYLKIQNSIHCVYIVYGWDVFEDFFPCWGSFKLGESERKKDFFFDFCRCSI